MGYVNAIGKYQIGRTIGEGTFAKVKLAVNTENRQYVAIKIIDKHMVVENNLTNQVKSEIRTMKLLRHPNIVRIHEVIGTKTKIHIVMEYVSGGQLSERMSYVGRLDEKHARKHFQQLIDAVDYCHCRGVYHRDLKPQNLLLGSKDNLKVSDFGLSALRKPGDVLSTACGSPSYVAPELLANKGYEGAAADVWSCGVILFELLAGRLPFDDQSLMNLYRKRITTAEIIEDQWFQTNYDPAVRTECEEDINFDDVHAAFSSVKDNEKHKTTLGSKLTISETIEKIEAAAKDVIEVAPTHCVVEISKSLGELEPYTEFCKSLSSMLLTEESGASSETQAPKEVIVNSKNINQSESFGQKDDNDTIDKRGYSSS
ncbi:hypothetical protein RHMOL_Rhmol03G0289400 [Rhododendron molle]|uniref:Uncharacterized protein n=1 Tax=Rhododendron molle TaxID=49168 RepID=A0ACC0PJM1_RHOML|nr:hypothetical protein RHMOL_Rhmol03G0289400 [Rhododendron molle]